MNGGAAEGLPQTSLTGICAHAVQGLCKVLQFEGNQLGLRVHELMLHFRVADGGPFPGMKPETFGQVFAAIAAEKGAYQPGTTIVMHSEENVQHLAQIL